VIRQSASASDQPPSGSSRSGFSTGRPTARSPESADTRQFWIQALHPSFPISIGDWAVREAVLPPGASIRIGETLLRLESPSSAVAGTGDEQRLLPAVPQGARPWLTQSASGRKTLWMVKKAAATPLSIYLAGETGTGKEVLAHLTHLWSDRAAGPFVPLHCGALALSLVESELFGHVKGAFTGANHHRAGALMQAHNGTLFLDEVGDLPPDIQVKLLRFLEDGEIRPVGADRCSRANVRLLCATHKPLLELVEQGKFRRDLYYRLASVTVEIPTLRERPEDIELLSRRFAAELGRTVLPKALLRLKAHSWPGNVRELRHAIERACGLAGHFSDLLGEDCFEFLLPAGSKTAGAVPEIALGAALSLVEMEKLMLIRALKLTSGHRGEAARLLGVARSTLFEMIKRHRIIGPRSPIEVEAEALSEAS
jgi:two-component system response regulator HydG